MRRSDASDIRKKNTREKIELGGLIAKAGLRYEKRALLLGVLLDAAERLRGNAAERDRLTVIGAKAFGHEDK